MDEIVIRMVSSKLLVEITLARVLEAVAENGKLALDITPAQVIHAVRDAAAKPPVAEATGKPGPQAGAEAHHAGDRLALRLGGHPKPAIM